MLNIINFIKNILVSILQYLKTKKDKPVVLIIENKTISEVKVETKPIEKQPTIEIKKDSIKNVEKVIKKTLPKNELISQIVVTRKTFTENSTIGTLCVDGKFVCYTLEDTDRFLEKDGIKIYGETAIPRGQYEIIINWSNRFKRLAPLLLNVPQFEGIRMHSGREIVTSIDTHGCLIPCFKIESNYTNSKEATKKVFELIEKKLKTSKVYITIK